MWLGIRLDYVEICSDYVSFSDCGLLCNQPITLTQVYVLEHYKSLGLLYYDMYIYVYRLCHIRTTTVVIGLLITGVCGHCNIRIDCLTDISDYRSVYNRRRE